MKTLAWLAAGIGIGFVIYLIANPPEMQYATGSDTLENAARSAKGWGARQRVTGAGADVLGRIKEGVGEFTGSPSLADQGTGDRVSGNINEGVGKIAQAAGQTLHDLNR